MLAALERLTKVMRQRAEPSDEGCLEPSLNGSPAAKAGKLNRKRAREPNRDGAKARARAKSFRK